MIGQVVTVSFYDDSVVNDKTQILIACPYLCNAILEHFVGEVRITATREDLPEAFDLVVPTVL
jgi:hypothetical protein